MIETISLVTLKFSTFFVRMCVSDPLIFAILCICEKFMFQYLLNCWSIKAFPNKTFMDEIIEAI